MRLVRGRVVVMPMAGVGLALMLASLIVPLLAAAGERTVSSAGFSAFGLICHQMPERSYFLAGQQVAVCQRYLAIFAGAAALGILYPRGPAEGISLRLYLLASMPLLIDGLTQLVGWRESTAVLRSATGLLFGAASVAYWSSVGATLIAWATHR